MTNETLKRIKEVQEEIREYNVEIEQLRYWITECPKNPCYVKAGESIGDGVLTRRDEIAILIEYKQEKIDKLDTELAALEAGKEI